MPAAATAAWVAACVAAAAGAGAQAPELPVPIAARVAAALSERAELEHSSRAEDAATEAPANASAGSHGATDASPPGPYAVGAAGSPYWWQLPTPPVIYTPDWKPPVLETGASTGELAACAARLHLRSQGGAAAPAALGQAPRTFVVRTCHAEVPGFNNQREVIELAVMVSIVTGGTLVLPEEARMRVGSSTDKIINGVKRKMYKKVSVLSVMDLQDIESTVPGGLLFIPKCVEKPKDLAAQLAAEAGGAAPAVVYLPAKVDSIVDFVTSEQERASPPPGPRLIVLRSRWCREFYKFERAPCGGALYAEAMRAAHIHEDIAADARIALDFMASAGGGSREHPSQVFGVHMRMGDHFTDLVPVFDWCDAAHGFAVESTHLPKHAKLRAAMHYADAGDLCMHAGESRLVTHADALKANERFLQATLSGGPKPVVYVAALWPPPGDLKTRAKRQVDEVRAAGATVFTWKDLERAAEAAGGDVWRMVQAQDVDSVRFAVLEEMMMAQASGDFVGSALSSWTHFVNDMRVWIWRRQIPPMDRT